MDTGKDESSHDECTERSGRAGRLRVRIARQDSVAISDCSESGEEHPFCPSVLQA